MALDDPQDFDGRLADERRRLAEDGDVHDPDRAAIERWLRRIDGRVKTSSMEAYLRRCRVGSGRSDQPLVRFDEADWHDFVFTLRHEHDLADSTVKSYENAILLFLQDTTDAEWPGAVDRTTVDREGPTVDEILTESDIHGLTQAARHQRDVAFIGFLADTGCRLSLALSLRVGDIDITQPATYVPNDEAAGLKGATITEYPLIDSAAALRAYLRTGHPRPDDDSVALFHKLKPHSREGEQRFTDDGSVNPNAMRQQLYRIADRAGVDKPTNPHAFRHAAITRMVREGYSRSQIEHRVHWSLDSDMWQIYEHITSDQHTADIFREAGVVDSEDGPQKVRKDCGNCTQPLAPHHEFCPNCGEPATPGASDVVEDDVDTILDAMLAEDNPAAAAELRALLDEIREHKALVSGDDHDDPP